MKNYHTKSVKTGIACLMLLWVVLFSFNVQARSQHYWVSEHIALSDDVVTFGHIAEPRTDKARERWSEVRELKLWRAPEAGQRIVLPRAQIKDRLAAVDKDIARNSIIPQEITFQRGAKVYSHDELAAMVEDYLMPRMRDMGEEVEFRDFRLPAPVYLENAYEQIEIQTSTDPAPGRNTLRISIIDAHGSVSKRLSGNVFADVWMTVACAAKPLNRGDVVGPKDVRFERKNLAYLRDDVWDGKTGPWRVRSSIGQGQPILQRALQTVPVVSRGERANLVYESGSVTLSVPVEVLEDGQKGDSIMVRNMQSRKEIAGIVQDGGTIIVR
ncbi:MAG: flagellar basal body P-ring formation chaperone FlgA [Desulfonatronovibrio sp.]